MIKLLVFQGTPVKPENWRDLVKAQLEGQPLPTPKYPRQNWKYPIAEHGFSDGGERLPAPSFTSSRNPTCQTCGLRQRTWEGGPERCACEDPGFDTDTVSDRQKFQEWCVTWLTECYRVLRPGGVAKIFGATRMMHRLAAAMEEAGFVLNSEHSIEAWSYGCLTEDTEILTEEGWRHYHSAKVGTLVLGFNPQTGQFDWQPVEETFEFPYDREAFHLIGDGSDHIVSVGHRCVVQRDNGWVFVRAEELASTEVVPCVQWQESSVPSPHLAGVTASIERVHYTGIVWCVKVPTGAFVARRNGMAFVTGNSGFPKSLNVGKKLDQMEHERREKALFTALREKGFDKVVWSTDRG